VAIPFDFLLEYAKLQLKARIITERFAMLFKLRVVRACVGEWHEVYMYIRVWACGTMLASSFIFLGV
jgi:hypothetical protein